jgi:hypothetical protein
VTGLLRFLYDFVVGDDWTLAVVVAGGIVAAWLIDRAGIAAWWALPVAVVAGLAASVARAARG